jgi:plastocyanin
MKKFCMSVVILATVIAVFAHPGSTHNGDILVASQTKLKGYADSLADAHFIVKQDSATNYKLSSAVLRQETVSLAVKLASIELPGNYVCQGYFRDVTKTKPNMWACRVVEIAADRSIITRARGHFEPEGSITRVEALAMLMKAAAINGADAGQTDAVFDAGVEGWQKDIILGAYNNKILSSTAHFYPNHPATRGDVFLLAYKIAEMKSLIAPVVIPSPTPLPTVTPVSTSTTINISGFAFNPSAVTIKKGTKVTWINKDTAPHTVTSLSDRTLNSPTLTTGKSYSFTFTDVGTFDYQCNFHTSMTGSVIVTE